MAPRFYSVYVLILTGFVFGQTIYLTGTVKNVQGNSVPNATVTLVGKNLSSVTAATGIYSISDDPTFIGRGGAGSPFFQLRGSHLEITLSNPEAISVTVFDLMGKKIKQLLNDRVATDMEYSLPVSENVVPGIQFIRVRAGKKLQNFKMVNTTPIMISIKTGNSVLNKTTSTIDELEVVSDGYFKKRVTLEKYVDTVDIVLEAEVSGPHIIFKDIFLGYDTITVGNIYRPVPLDRGNTLLLNIALENVGTENALSVTCSLTTEDPYVSVTNAVSGFNNIGGSRDTLNHTPFSVSVSDSIPPARPVLFQLHIKDSWGSFWRDSCVYVINPFIIEMENIDDDAIPDSRGNDNDFIDPLEIIEYTPRLQNKSGMEITNVHALLLSKQDNITVSNADKNWGYGDFLPEQKQLPEWDYVFNSPIGLIAPAKFDLMIFGNVVGKSRKWLLPFSLPTNFVDISDTTFIDSRDGKEYDAVFIGNQVWMAENLAYLPQVDSAAHGSEDNLNGKYYYVYGYAPIGISEPDEVSTAKTAAHYRNYGVLYNWNAAMDGAVSSSTSPSGIQGACPGGWHLPSEAEMKTLEMYFGMSQSEADNTGWRGTVEGKELKSTVWDGLYAPGFSARPGGGRTSDSFNMLGSIAYFWTTTEDGAGTFWYRTLDSEHNSVRRSLSTKSSGFSVRCLQD